MGDGIGYEKERRLWVEFAKGAGCLMGVIGALVVGSNLTDRQDPIKIPEGVAQLQDSGEGDRANKNFHAPSISQAEQIDCGNEGSLFRYTDNVKAIIALKGQAIVVCEEVGSSYPIQQSPTRQVAIDNR